MPHFGEDSQFFFYPYLLFLHIYHTCLLNVSPFSEFSCLCHLESQLHDSRDVYWVFFFLLLYSWLVVANEYLLNEWINGYVNKLSLTVFKEKLHHTIHTFQNATCLFFFFFLKEYTKEISGDQWTYF